MKNTNCTNIKSCDYCDSCYSCYYCNSCDYCNSCKSCDYCDYCDYCRSLKMTEYNIFCAAKEFNDENSFQQERYRAFNKVVGEKRYREILAVIRTDILKDLKLELNEKSWEDEWKKVTPAQWSRMKNEIPEYDEGVVEMIIGFKPEYETNDATEEAIKLLKEKGYKIVKE